MWISKLRWQIWLNQRGAFSSVLRMATFPLQTVCSLIMAMEQLLFTIVTTLKVIRTCAIGVAASVWVALGRGAQIGRYGLPQTLVTSRVVHLDLVVGGLSQITWTLSTFFIAGHSFL